MSKVVSEDPDLIADNIELTTQLWMLFLTLLVDFSNREARRHEKSNDHSIVDLLLENKFLKNRILELQQS